MWKGGKNEEGWGRPPREKAKSRGSLSPVHGGLCDRHRLQKMFLNFPSSGAGAVHTRRAFRDGSDLVPTVRCGEPRSRRPTADRRELRPSDPRAQRGADPDPAGGRTNATLPSAPRISRRGWTATDFFKRKRESGFLRLGRRTISSTEGWPSGYRGAASTPSMHPMPRRAPELHRTRLTQSHPPGAQRIQSVAICRSARAADSRAT